MKTYINPERTKALLDHYRQAAPGITLRPPDIGHLPGTPQEYAREWERLIGLPEQNEKRFFAALENPLPVYLGEVKRENGEWLFVWSNSYDLQGDDIAYHFQISQTPDFAKPVVDRNAGLKEASARIEILYPLS